MNLFQPKDSELLLRTLEARKYTLRQVFSEHVVEQMGFDVAADRFLNYVVISATMNLHGEKVAKAEAEETMTFPTTWWQHLKLQHAPEWFKARWPVKTTMWRLKVVADQWRMYHNMQTPLPEKDWGRAIQLVDPRTYSVWESHDLG